MLPLAAASSAGQEIRVGATRNGAVADIIVAHILAAMPGSYAIFGAQADIIYSGSTVAPDHPLITIIKITDITSLT